jgi:hypothetical protein
MRVDNVASDDSDITSGINSRASISVGEQAEEDSPRDSLKAVTPGDKSRFKKLSLRFPCFTISSTFAIRYLEVSGYYIRHRDLKQLWHKPPRP